MLSFARLFEGMGAIMYKETRHILRDPRTLFLMLLVPSAQLTIFGYAINMDVQHIPTAIYDLDGRESSKDLIDAFVNSGYFDIKHVAYSDEDLFREVVRGHVSVALKIPPDYTDRVLLGQPVQVQVLIDGSNSTVAMQALNVSSSIALRESITSLARSLGVAASTMVEARARVLFNPDMRTANFMVPGLVGVILQLVTMLLTAFSIVREKENGTLEQLMVTPVSRLGLIVGKLVPYGVVGIIETISVIIVMRVLFQVPVAGSLLLLGGFTLIFLCTTLGLGLLISTVARNQMEALQVAFLVILPSILLSGFIFPQENMPYPIYVIGQFVPVTYFIRILRGIILRDAGFIDLWQNGAILIVMGFVVLMLATLRFSKRMA